MMTWFRAVVTTTKGEKFQISSLDYDQLNFAVKVFDFLQGMGVEPDHIEITEGD